MPAIVKATFKMREAIAAQDLIESLEMRRSLQAYGLESAQRRFGVWLKDEALGLSAKTDLLLESTDRIAVVDFKLTASDVGDNHRMQLAGYSMLAEVAYQRPAPVAFLFRIPDSRVFAIEITLDLRTAVTKAIADIRHMADEQICPPPTPVRGRCLECEFANYCADIW